MELKVWTDGVPRIISGIHDDTTCHDVVVALAQATHSIGRFTLTERWRESERLLSPDEKPLEVLRKWGEYGPDVQFILKRSGKHKHAKRTDEFTHNFTPHTSQPLRRSLTFSGARSPVNSSTSSRNSANDNGSLEGTEDQSSLTSFSSRSSLSPYASLERRTQGTRHVAPPRAASSPYSSLDRTNGAQDKNRTQSPTTSQSHTSPRRSRDKKQNGPSPSRVSQNAPPSSLLLSNTPTTEYSQTRNGGSPVKHNGISPIGSTNSPSRGITNHIRHPHTISSSSLSSSPAEQKQRLKDNTLPPDQSHRNSRSLEHQPLALPDSPLDGSIVVEHYDLDRHLETVSEEEHRDQTDSKSTPTSKSKPVTESNGSLNSVDFQRLVTASDKADLLKLVQLQQARLIKQEKQLAHCDAEIEVVEKQSDEIRHELEVLTVRATAVSKEVAEGDDELQTLELVSWEDQLILEQRTAARLQRDIDQQKLRMAEKDAEVRHIQDSAESLQQSLLKRNKEADDKMKQAQQEISKLQAEIEKLTQEEKRDGTVEEVLAEVTSLEEAIEERKTVLADLEHNLADTNMQVFLRSPSPASPTLEDISFGRLSPSLRPGSARKMTHSPHRLKDAVATPKNPHGLWV